MANGRSWKQNLGRGSSLIRSKVMIANDVNVVPPQNLQIFGIFHDFTAFYSEFDWDVQYNPSIGNVESEDQSL